MKADFPIGQKVTISEDWEGLHPLQVGEVRRRGVGAWHLKKTDAWFSYETGAQVNRSHRYAHLYQEGDEERVAVERVRQDRIRFLQQEIPARVQVYNAQKQSLGGDIGRAKRGIQLCEEEQARLDRRIARERQWLAEAEAKLRELETGATLTDLEALRAELHGLGHAVTGITVAEFPTPKA